MKTQDIDSVPLVTLDELAARLGMDFEAVYEWVGPAICLDWAGRLCVTAAQARSCVESYDEWLRLRVPSATWARAITRSKLPWRVRFVALVMALVHMEEDGGSFSVSRDQLVRETRLSVGAVARAIKALEDGGWLVVKRSHSRTNVYQAVLPETVAAESSGAVDA